MNISRHLSRIALAAALSGLAAPAAAVVGYADFVWDYFDSGAGPFAGPYGGNLSGPVPRASAGLSVVLGPDGPDPDFLSLPTGSYVTVGFNDEIVTDGAGFDIFISEVGVANEAANIFVTPDFVTYTFLGLASDATVSTFDLASIGYTGNVVGVRIVGLDSFGGSPGFDLSFVQVLPGAFEAISEPTTWAMMLFGFGAVGLASRRRRRLATA